MANQSPMLSLQTISGLYTGKLTNLLAGLAGNLASDAIDRMPRHVTDPNGEARKGQKTFRLDKSFDYNGKWFYNSPETNHGIFNCVQYLTGWDMKTIHAEANKFVRNEGVSPATVNHDEIAEREADRERKQQLEYAENASKLKKAGKKMIPVNSLAAFPVLAYLGKRSLPLALSALPAMGYAADMDYWDSNLNHHGKHPCMINKVTTPEGQFVTYHRTYLDMNGNKLKLGSDDCDFEAPEKKLMSPCRNSKGASIKFHQPVDGVIAIAEGVETALSVYLATSHPVWATVSAGMMGNLDVPDNVRLILLYADKDRSKAGQIAAEKLQARMAEKGVTVLIFYPPSDIPEGEKSIDWNDELAINGSYPFVATMQQYVQAHEELRRHALVA